MVTGKKRSLNTYSHHAPKWDWIKQYFKYKNEFNENHTLGSQMYNFFRSFLRDAGLLDKEGFSETARLIEQLGYEKDQSWGIIFTNLCYSPQVNWYVKNVDFDAEYSKPLLASMMVNEGAKESWTNDIFASLNRLSELPMGRIGFGKIIKEKEKAVGIIRKSWSDPIPEIILYALYKFAEECDGYYQFSLKTLLDDSIARLGVSPTRIFGLDKEMMVRILNGLSINYPDFISVSFTLDLDNITLREEKAAKEVLTLL